MGNNLVDVTLLCCLSQLTLIYGLHLSLLTVFTFIRSCVLVVLRVGKSPQLEAVQGVNEGNASIVQAITQALQWVDNYTTQTVATFNERLGDAVGVGYWSVARYMVGTERGSPTEDMIFTFFA